MSTPIIEHGSDSFCSDSTSGIAANKRVVFNASGKLVLAGATTRETGVTKTKSSDHLTPVEVRLCSAPGSLAVTTNADTTAGAEVYRAASGDVAPTGSSAYGRARDGGANGDAITVYPY